MVGGERRVAILKLFHQDKLFANFILHTSLSTIIVIEIFDNLMLLLEYGAIYIFCNTLHC